MELPTSLHSSRKLSLLNDIDKLRSLGVSQFVDLPQLIVCGDQSSGKSSVLEAISGIPFPTKDNLCTRFATEVILRNSAEPSITVSILADPEKSVEDRESITKFRYELPSFEDFPALVGSALECMEVAAGKQAFFQDILQVKVAGPQQPHLTIVDLPGLIHSQNKQQTMDDVKVVKSMVSRYMERPRSIILAVVSAKNDYANQIILSLAREFDSDGTRTLGIITKPDELRPDSESERSFVDLARNQNVEFHLGWHVLRNRDYKEKLTTKEERDEVERNFFEHGVWRMLPTDTVGVDSLRPKLSEILFSQIKRQLPDLIRDIEIQIGRCQDTLTRLGPPRTTLTEQKRFLISVGQEFQHIVECAVQGRYDHPFFNAQHTVIGRNNRLRAVVQDENLKFAEEMRLKGQLRKVISDDEPVTQDTVRRSDYLNEIQELMRTNRGRELPGMLNPLLVGDLFRQQSKPWDKIIESHSLAVWGMVRSFLESVTLYLCSDNTSEGLLSQMIDPLMDARRKAMEAKIEELLRPYRSGHPITYNHYFTETIQKSRWPEGSLQATMKLLGYDPEKHQKKQHLQVDMHKIRAVLATSNQPNMDLFGCEQILGCMKAFYKVAMKSIIDNVAIYAIEQCLLSSLDSLLSPSSIWEMSDNLVKSVSAEPPQNERQRALTLRKLDILRKGATTCQVHSTNSKEFETENRSKFASGNLQSPATDNEADCGVLTDDSLDNDSDASSEDKGSPAEEATMKFTREDSKPPTPMDETIEDAVWDFSAHAEQLQPPPNFVPLELGSTSKKKKKAKQSLGLPRAK